MSNTVYIAKGTTTFSKIAQRVLGLSAKGPEVAAANPGIVEPIMAGTEVLVPRDTPILEGDILLEGVDVGINGQHLANWDRLTLNQNFTGVSTFSLSILNRMSEQVKPFGYEKIEIYGDRELLFTGRCLTYDTDTSGSLLQISGYSLPGVLGDCTAPMSAWPLEFDELNIAQIAAKLVAPFGVKVVCDKPGDAFEITDCKTGDKVLKYLDSLAGMRNLSLRSDAKGQLVIAQAITDSLGDRVELTIGQPPLTKASFTANGQALYSDIVGSEPMMHGLGGSISRSKDPRVTVFRPLVYDIPAVLDTKVETDAKVRHARRYIGAMGLRVSLATWKRPDDKAWEVGQVIDLTGTVGKLNFDKAALVVSKVQLDISSDRGATADLTLNLPEVYKGEIPKEDIWEL